MENDVKVPIIILTRNLANGEELKSYLSSRFSDKDLHIEVCNVPEECMKHLTVKHHNIVVVDYDKELYERAEELIYNKPEKLATSLVLSSAHDVQFVFRKPSEHHVDQSLKLRPGMAELIVEDQKDHESVAMIISELLSQGKARKGYNHKNMYLAAALLVFFVILAIVIM